MAGFGFLPFILLVGGGAAAGTGLLRRDAIPFAVAPSLQFALAVAQSKGWTYQFAIVVGSAMVFLTMVLSAVWDDPHGKMEWSTVRKLGAIGLLVLVGDRAFDLVRDSYWLKEDKQLMSSPELNDPRITADVLRAKTRPDDRLFFYGQDAIIGFLAQRLPATPYEVAWMLNYRGALEPGDGFKKAAPQHREDILKFQKVVQTDACARLRARHPAAMVFMDGLPESGADGVQEVGRFCPELLGMLQDEYYQAAHNGAVRLYLRADRP